jgi:hypothetical protein
VIKNDGKSARKPRRASAIKWNGKTKALPEGEIADLKDAPKVISA